MLRSMTGYGRAAWEGDGKRIEVEVKSFNHRFLDIVSHLPRKLEPLDPQVRTLVRQRLSRGRIEIGIQMEECGEGELKLELNLSAAREYYQALRSLQESLGIGGEIRVETLAGFRDLFLRRETPVDLEKEWSRVRPVLDEALDRLEEMRGEEGRALRGDLLSRIQQIDQITQAIDERNVQALPAHRDRLAERIRALTEGLPLDPIRLAQEAAILAERSDITEELVRIRSHLNQLREMLDRCEPVGRKLDFLTQEIHREVNTIGSKAIDAAIGQAVVSIKSELEKIREQLQNIE
jgi:uncharacterized protein (TIGR00255 family)